MSKQRYYHIISLGCSKNLVDSEVFAGITEEHGFHYTDQAAQAELILVNTCGFIADAKEEGVLTILEAATFKETGNCIKLVVTGCLVQRYKADLETQIPEVDEWVDLKDFDTYHAIFAEVVDSLNPRRLLTPPHFAYLRISDGCNNRCSYCAIPDIRGNLVSVPMETILAEAETLAQKGVKELIISAQDTTRYGEDLYGKSRLPELLTELHKIAGLHWIRLLYLHPARITKHLLETISGLPRICRYFEIPVQHISDTILQSMGRGISKQGIYNVLNEIKEMLPEAVLRTTLLVGYPGETDKHFAELVEFVKTMKFGRLGVFTYSPEENTPAFKRSQRVPVKKAQARKDELMSLQQEISADFLSAFVGRKLEVMIDGKSDMDDFRWEARTYFDAPDIDGKVYIEKGKVKPGDFVIVEITDHSEYDLVGEIVSPTS
jgi:ribosomal protein S12 methylthiotransferase